MGVEMTIVSSDALETLIDEVRGLRLEVLAVQMQPAPQWITVSEMARMVGRSESTINRRISTGELESRMTAGVKMVRV